MYLSWYSTGKKHCVQNRCNFMAWHLVQQMLPFSLLINYTHCEVFGLCSKWVQVSQSTDSLIKNIWKPFAWNWLQIGKPYISVLVILMWPFELTWATTPITILKTWPCLVHQAYWWPPDTKHLGTKSIWDQQFLDCPVPPAGGWWPHPE